MIFDDYAAIAKRARALSGERVLLYPSNANLLIQIAASKELGKVNSELASMIVRIVERWLRKPNFRDFAGLDLIHAEALDHLCKPRVRHDGAFRLPVALQFDPTKSQNPHAFFVQVIQGVAHRATTNLVKPSLSFAIKVISTRFGLRPHSSNDLALPRSGRTATVV